MTAAKQTLLLDPLSWDLVEDASGNIAVASPPYALAQDAASSIKLFSGELYYDTSQGVDHWGQILGHWPPLSLVKARLAYAAETVPGVVSAVTYLTKFVNRQFTGQVQIKDDTGTTSAAGF
jgi:hypothetical protein